jgi:hypothetical protein
VLSYLVAGAVPLLTEKDDKECSGTPNGIVLMVAEIVVGRRQHVTIPLGAFLGA